MLLELAMLEKRERGFFLGCSSGDFGKNMVLMSTFQDKPAKFSRHDQYGDKLCLLLLCIVTRGSINKAMSSKWMKSQILGELFLLR